MPGEQHAGLIAVALPAGASPALLAGCGAPTVTPDSQSSASSAAGATDPGWPAADRGGSLGATGNREPPGGQPPGLHRGCPACPASLRAALPPWRPVAVPQAMAARRPVYADNQGRMELAGRGSGNSLAQSWAAQPRGGRPPGTWPGTCRPAQHADHPVLRAGADHHVSCRDRGYFSTGQELGRIRNVIGNGVAAYGSPIPRAC